jgi:hypothetical protein
LGTKGNNILRGRNGSTNQPWEQFIYFTNK